MRFGGCTRAMLAFCFASLAFLGCSGEDYGSKRGGEVEVGGGRGTADGPRGYVRIEMAYLSSAGDADLMDARVRFDGEAVWPDCFLVEGPTMEALERAEERGGVYERRMDSFWANPGTTEKRLEEGGTLTFSFHKEPGSDAPDPDRTPYFVYCTGGGGPAGYDRAHVEGTPEP